MSRTMKNETIRVRVESDLKNKLGTIAKKENRSISNLVHQILSTWARKENESGERK